MLKLPRRHGMDIAARTWVRTRAAYFQELLKTSFWLTPGLTAIAVVMTLPLAKWLEGTPVARLPLLEGQTLEGTRLVLSSIATAVMTVVGVLFSVTIVVLQQVSQQYSPRVIENFIRSTSNQFVLGFYIGTFAYCVLLLGTIQERGERAPVVPPSLGIVLGMACLALLIYFVHHLAKSIRSNTIAADIARQAVAAMDDLRADLAAASRELERAAGPVQRLRSEDNGYLQEINFGAISQALSGGRWRARLLVIPGDYLFREVEIIEIQRAAPLDERARRAIVRAFRIDLVRTHSQDVRFGVQELQDIALRALSPGINDPSTAIEALNEIGTILIHHAASAPSERPVLCFDEGVLELAQPSFDEFLDLCVNDIAIAGRSFFRVQQRIHAVLERCEAAAGDESRRRSVRAKRQALARFREDLPSRDLYHESLLPVRASGAGDLSNP